MDTNGMLATNRLPRSLSPLPLSAISGYPTHPLPTNLLFILNPWDSPRGLPGYCSRSVRVSAVIRSVLPSSE